MIRRIDPVPLRATTPAARAPLTGLVNAIRATLPGATLTAIETEAPMNIAEELGLIPSADGKGLTTPDGHTIPGSVLVNLQKAADAWAAVPEADRLAIGHVRYHFHPSGAVLVQRIEDPRKSPRRPMSVKVR